MATENKASSLYAKDYIKNFYLSGRALQLSCQKVIRNEDTDKKISFWKTIIKYYDSA